MALEDKNMISDEFWLNIGAEVVYKSLDSCTASVEKLQSTIVWIFGIYSTITIGTVVFSSPESWCDLALLFFGLAFLFLIISYWVATTATFTRLQDFYGNAVTSIRDSYLMAVKRSTKTFTWAIVLCSFGVLFYSSALFLQFGSPMFNKNCKAVVPKVLNESDSLLVEVKLVAVNTFALQIQSRKNSWVNYNIQSDTTIDMQTKTEKIPFIVQQTKIKTMWVHVDTSAMVNQIMKVDIRPNRKYQLSITRTDTLNQGFVLYTIRKKIILVP